MDHYDILSFVKSLSDFSLSLTQKEENKVIDYYSCCENVL